jgi:hypothetical protein
MESKLLSSPDASVPVALVPTPQSNPEVDALAEVREAIAADCRIDPKAYLDEIRVAAGGE